jgi:hypothetical protein
MDPRLAMMFPAGGGMVSSFGLGMDPNLAGVMQFIAPTEQGYQTASLLMQMARSGSFGPTATSLPLLHANPFQGVPFLGSTSPGILSSLVSMFGAPLVQTIARQHRLIPMGMGHDLNIYDFMLRSQASADRLEKLLAAQRLDVVGYMEAIRGLANLAGVPFGLEQQLAVRNLISTVQPYIPMLSMLAPDLADQLSGRRGSMSALGLKLIGAGRYRIDPITGRLGLSTETITTYIESIFEELLSDPELRRSRGLSAGQLGALFEQLQLRGMLPSTVTSPYERLTPYRKLEQVLEQVTPFEQGLILSSIGERFEKARPVKPINQMKYDELREYISNTREILKKLQDDVLEELINLPEINTRLARFDARNVIRKLEGYANAVNAMKEIFAEAGYKNVPVEVAMRGIEVFTQGQAQQYTSDQIANMLRSTRNIANLTGTTIDTFIQMQNHAAAVLKQANLPTAYANPITQQTVLHMANIRGMGALSVPSPYTPSEQEATQAVMNASMSFVASPLARIASVALKLDESNLVEQNPNNPLFRLVRQIKSGGPISEEFLNKTESELTAMLYSGLVSPHHREVVTNLLQDPRLIGQYVNQLVPLSLPTQREEVIRQTATSLAAGSQILRKIATDQVEKTGKQLTNEQKQQRAYELSMKLSEEISRTLLDMSPQDFSNDAKRNALVRDVIIRTLGLEGEDRSRISETDVAALVTAAIPTFNRVLQQRTRWSVTDLGQGRAVFSKQAIFGTQASRVIADTRSQIQERMQHLGPGDSIIRNLITTLQAAGPENRLTLMRTLLGAIGTQSMDEVVGAIDPVIENLTKELKNLEKLEKEISDPNKFPNLSPEQQRKMLQDLEVRKQGVLHALDEVRSVAERYGLTRPVKRLSPDLAFELGEFEKTLTQLNLENLGYSAIDTRLAAQIAASDKDLARYLPLVYEPIKGGPVPDLKRPAPLIPIGAFQSFVAERLQNEFQMVSKEKGKDVRPARETLLDSVLRRTLGLSKKEGQEWWEAYDQGAAQRALEDLERELIAFTPGDADKTRKLAEKIGDTISAVHTLFSPWIQVQPLGENFTEKIKRDLADETKREKLLRFVTGVARLVAHKDPSQWGPEEAGQLLALAIESGHIVPDKLKDALLGNKQLTYEEWINLLSSSISNRSKGANFLYTYEYRPPGAAEGAPPIRPFIDSEKIKALNEDRKKQNKEEITTDQIDRANTLLASIFLSEQLPTEEKIKEDPFFKALKDENLQNAVLEKYNKFKNLDERQRREIVNQLEQNRDLIRASMSGSPYARLHDLLRHTGYFQKIEPLDPRKMKEELARRGIINSNVLEQAMLDPARNLQVQDLFNTIHILNQTGFRTFEHIQDSMEQLKRSGYNPESPEAISILSQHLKTNVLRRLENALRPTDMSNNLNQDLILHSLELALNKYGGPERVATTMSRITQDFYQMLQEQEREGGGLARLDLNQQMRYAELQNRLQEYYNTLAAHGGDFGRALGELKPEDRGKFIQGIVRTVQLFRKVADPTSSLSGGPEATAPIRSRLDARTFLSSRPPRPATGKEGGPAGSRTEPSTPPTPEQLIATDMALQLLSPSEIRLAASSDQKRAIAQRFTHVLRHFGIDPQTYSESMLNDREKIAFFFLTHGYSKETLEELRKNKDKFNQKDETIQKLLALDPDKDGKEIREIIEGFIEGVVRDRSHTLLRGEIPSEEYLKRIKEVPFLEGGLGAAGDLLFMGGMTLSSIGGRAQREVLKNLPRIEAQEAYEAYIDASYKEFEQPMHRLTLDWLKREGGSTGIDEALYGLMVDDISRAIFRKENWVMQPEDKKNIEEAVKKGLRTSGGKGGVFGSAVMFSVTGAATAGKAVADAKKKRLLPFKNSFIEWYGISEEQADSLINLIASTDFREELRKMIGFEDPEKYIKQLYDPRTLGAGGDEREKQKYNEIVQKFKSMPVLTVQARSLLEERQKEVEKLSSALSSFLGPEKFKQEMRDQGITDETHFHDRAVKLLSLAQRYAREPGFRESGAMGAAELLRQNLVKAENLIKSTFPTGRLDNLTNQQRPTQQGGQGTAQQQQPTGVLPSPLTTPQGANQLGQNMPPTPTEPGRMDISGRLIIEGLGQPVTATLRGYGSIPSNGKVR